MWTVSNFINDLILTRFRPFAASWFMATLTLTLGVLILFRIDTNIVEVSYWRFLSVAPSWIIGLSLIIFSIIRIISLILFSINKVFTVLSQMCIASCILTSIFWGQIFFGDITFRDDYLFGKTVHLWLFFISLWNIVTVIIDL